MKHKLMIPDGRPLADFLPTLTIKAKDFATELTSHNVIEKDLSGANRISNEHVENNIAKASSGGPFLADHGLPWEFFKIWINKQEFIKIMKCGM